MAACMFLGRIVDDGVFLEDWELGLVTGIAVLVCG